MRFGVVQHDIVWEDREANYARLAPQVARAAAAGADAAIVISAGYFVGALAGSKSAQKKLFTDVADASPIPVVIYNCALGTLERPLLIAS